MESPKNKKAEAAWNGLAPRLERGDSSSIEAPLSFSFICTGLPKQLSTSQYGSFSPSI